MKLMLFILIAIQNNATQKVYYQSLKGLGAYFECILLGILMIDSYINHYCCSWYNRDTYKASNFWHKWACYIIGMNFEIARMCRLCRHFFEEGKLHGLQLYMGVFYAGNAMCIIISTYVPWVYHRTIFKSSMYISFTTLHGYSCGYGF